MIAFLSLVIGYFVLMGAFVLVMHAKKLNDEAKLSLFWRVHIFPWVVVGLALDVAFNAVAGTLMFVELPREWLFTTRCKRHFRGSEGWRLSIAKFWARTLNEIDPTHITPPKG